MKHRVLDVMNEALGLVKKSDLGGATALIRKALVRRDRARRRERRSENAPPPVHRRKSFRCRRAARWAKPCARFALRPIMPAGLPTRPNPGPRRISANAS